MADEQSRPAANGAAEMSNVGDGQRQRTARAGDTPTNVADTAHRAHRAGMSVVPPREDGSKTPLGTWKKYQAARAGQAQLAHWYGPSAGVGVVCGTVSGGLEMLELEGCAVAEGCAQHYRQLVDAAGYGDLLTRIMDGYCEQTPSGGYHLLYRVPTPRGNTKLASRPATPDELAVNPAAKVRVLIETRGEGGYTIIAPTNGQVHPDGGRWLLLAGGVDSIAEITDDERDELWRIAQMLDQPDPDELRDQMAREARRPTGVGDWKTRPGDDYNTRGDPQTRVRDLLEAHGWEVACRKGDVDYMRRPGKTRGMSATLRAEGTLYLFTTSTDFQALTPYTPFGVYTHLEHRGDYKAAAKALHAGGYGELADDTPPQPKAPPRLDVDPCTLDDAHKKFRRWLGDTYDLDVLDAVLATAAAEQLGGDPLWLLVLSGPGNAKTETVQALTGVGAHITSTITSEGALLSATPKRDKAKGATGGLLRAIGDRGLLVIKDVTSILSADRNVRGQVLAALREVHDGRWDRNVGVDGGRTLTWTGRLVVVGAVTSAWDRAHDVVSTMGDRFVIIRADSHEGRDKAGRRAIKNKGDEQQMRQELAVALAGVVAGVDPDHPFALTKEEETQLVDAADLVTLARTSVQYDYRGDVVDADAPEMPTRFAKQLAQMMHGAIAIGMGRQAAMRLAIRCARDSMPPLRLAILEDVAAHPHASTHEVRERLDKPRATVDRQLQSLHMLRVLTCDEVPYGPTGERTRWHYTITDGIRPSVLLVPDLLVEGRQDEREERANDSEGSHTPSHKSGTNPTAAGHRCPRHRGAGSHDDEPCPDCAIGADTQVVSLRDKIRCAELEAEGRLVRIDRKSDWGNPFFMDEPGNPRDGDRATVIAKFAAYLDTRPDLIARLHELRGKALACWCAPEPCHGNVLKKRAEELTL